MQFKLNENLPIEMSALLKEHSHDADTVKDESLCGAPDSRLISLCQEERRALITLDMGFTNIRNYPPEDYHGLIVLRLAKQDKEHVLAHLRKIAPFLQGGNVKGHLWIVEENKIRIRKGRH